MEAVEISVSSIYKSIAKCVTELMPRTPCAPVTEELNAAALSFHI